MRAWIWRRRETSAKVWADLAIARFDMTMAIGFDDKMVAELRDTYIKTMIRHLSSPR